MKKKNESFVRCCANCEHASREEEEEEEDTAFFYCHKKKKKYPAIHVCRRFFFDLLKYSPRAPREIPTLDPSLTDL